MFNQAGPGGHGQEGELTISYSAQPHVGKLIFSYSADSEEAARDAIEGHISAIKDFAKNLSRLITTEELERMAKEQRVENAGLLDSPHYFGMFKAGNAALGGGATLLHGLSALENVNASDMVGQLQDFDKRAHYFNIYAPQQWTMEQAADSVAGINRTVLPSGAVLISKSSGDSPMFGMHLMIKNRHVIEDSLAGGAEILHGMLTSGTGKYNANQIKARIAELGITLKTQDMGFIPYDDYYNSPDYGYVRLECLVEDAPEAIQFLGHLMSDAQITEEGLTTALSGANRRVAQQTSTARYTAMVTYDGLLLGADHPSTKLVSGDVESLARINSSNLAQLRDKYFVPSNYIVTVSSSLPHDDLANLLNTIWPDTGEPVERVIPQIASNAKAQEKIIDLGKEQAQIRLGYTFDIEEKDKAAFNLAVRILSDRMQFDLREQQGLAYRLGVSTSYEGETGWITATIGTGVQNIDRVVPAMKGYLRASKLANISEDDIIQLANAERGRYMRRNLARVGQAFFLGYYEYYAGDYNMAEEVGSSDAIPSLKAVKAAANKYLNLPSNYTLVVVK
jgi:predicted Zn-dependent peptidase